MPPNKEPDHKDESPPIFKRWSTLYGLVLLFHVLVIILFSFLTSLYQ